jgi:hypothetical protein
MNYIILTMKNQIEQMIEILTRTENDLQKVIVEAAQTGDYRSVDIARDAAVNIQSLRKRISNPSSILELKAGNSMLREGRKVSSRKVAKSGYPRFQVSNNTLIRVGWSKKQRREYIHKVPRIVVDRTVKSMAELAQSAGGPIMSEQIIEHINNSESETIPSYQVYVVIGLLRKTNCIKQSGREGYYIPPDILAKAEGEWGNMSDRKN